MMFPTPCVPPAPGELKSMQPGSRSKAYRPPEAGRSKGPNAQMGEVRPLTREKGLEAGN